MNTQEFIEQNVKMLIGDLQLQLLLARAETQSLKEQLEAATPKDPLPEAPAAKPNGKTAEARQ